MSEPEISTAIRGLASADLRVRGEAAGRLYQRGAAQAEAATAAWRKVPEFVSLLAGEPTVGIAVYPETFERIRAACGGPKLAGVPPDQDAREFELHFAAPKISLDILTTREPGGSGAIARFLDRRGEGIQQVELPVQDVDRATALLRERLTVEPIYPATRAGADGTRVNFFLVSVPEGGKILIELVEAEARPGH